ncbi:MAG TPA: BamA/TamA family outer membrane protein, partial [Candidatus Binataceae bacterium]|nr:BamA/TamA family outer membrane protein [Candidatus Binataceae bacterium]
MIAAVAGLLWSPAMVSTCRAESQVTEWYPITEAEADAGSGAISEAPVGNSAPMPANSSGVAPSTGSTGTVPKTGSPAASVATPAAAASPGIPTTSAGKNPAERLSVIFHPEQWQFLHKFSLTDPGTWPFIPVPEVATDPNGGTTGGVLAAVLYTDSRNQISDIFAPDIESNTTLGAGGTLRYLSFPSEDTNWYATAGAQERILRRVDIDYQTGRTHKEWWSFEGRLFWEKDPTERFFGVGNDTRLGNETNYTTNQLYALGVFGLNFTEDLQLALNVRPRRIRIDRGAFHNVPSIFRLFPHQKGINGGSEVPGQLVLAYDTRDSLEVPRKGGLAQLYFGIADRAFLSSVSYTRFGGELRRYYAFNDKITFAGHVFLEYNPSGNETPFWSMARLGGEESILTDQETLRGYGAGRYIDNSLAVANAEVRARVWDHDIFGTHGILELAPFFDIGRVAHNISFDPLSDTHAVGGVGFRGIAEPFVVGYVDVGYGGEGV